MGTPFFLLFVLCVCFFHVCCVRLARQGHGEEHAARGRALHWECAPRRNSKQMCQLCQANSQTSTQIGDFSTRLSPKQLHNFKKTFRLYHATPPQTICTNLPTFPRDFPQKTFRIFASSMTSGHLCAILADWLSPQISSLGYASHTTLSQNTCVTASLARF